MEAYLKIVTVLEIKFDKEYKCLCEQYSTIYCGSFAARDGPLLKTKMDLLCKFYEQDRDVLRKLFLTEGLVLEAQAEAPVQFQEQSQSQK